MSYDKLLLNFDEYQALVRLVVDKVKGCRRCLDFGAGTGNGTLQFLETNPAGEIWAVEANHAMLQRLIAKIQAAEQRTRRDHFGRLHLCKEDLLRLHEQREFLEPGSYDAAILINVLYAVQDPEQCLREVFDLLQPGGRVAFSTPHRETDVDKLFDGMRKSLQAGDSCRGCKATWTTPASAIEPWKPKSIGTGRRTSGLRGKRGLSDRQLAGRGVR